MLHYEIETDLNLRSLQTMSLLPVKESPNMLIDSLVSKDQFGSYFDLQVDVDEVNLDDESKDNHHSNREMSSEVDAEEVRFSSATSEDFYSCSSLFSRQTIFEDGNYNDSVN